MAVTVRVDEDGRARPMSIQWYDGTTFAIDEILQVQRQAARKAGGDGICYTIRIGKQVTHLYQDETRWFVEEKAAPL